MHVRSSIEDGNTQIFAAEYLIMLFPNAEHPTAQEAAVKIEEQPSLIWHKNPPVQGSAIIQSVGSNRPAKSQSSKILFIHL